MNSELILNDGSSVVIRMDPLSIPSWIRRKVRLVKATNETPNGLLVKAVADYTTFSVATIIGVERDGKEVLTRGGKCYQDKAASHYIRIGDELHT